MALKVGFIGLGIMGQPMAQNVVKGGHALIVYNRSIEKATPFGEAGATVAPTPKAVAEASDVIILMLAGPEAIDAVLEGYEYGFTAVFKAACRQTHRQICGGH